MRRPTAGIHKRGDVAPDPGARFLASPRGRLVPSCRRPVVRPSRCSRLRGGRGRRVRRRLGARSAVVVSGHATGPACPKRTDSHLRRHHGGSRRPVAVARSGGGAVCSRIAVAARRVHGVRAGHGLHVAAPPGSGVVRRPGAGDTFVRAIAIADSTIRRRRCRGSGSSSGPGDLATRLAGRRRTARGGRGIAAARPVVVEPRGKGRGRPAASPHGRTPCCPHCCCQPPCVGVLT
jgi:hypothetical protein